MVDVPLRHRSRPDAAGKSAGHGGWMWPLVAVVVAVAGVLLLGFLLHLAIDTYRERMTLTGLTNDTRPVHLTIAGEQLAIPANMIRFAETRRGGAVERADLVIHWPMLEGYTERLADAFKDGSPSAPIVFATIAGRDTPLDSTERLTEVYAGFFVGKPIAGPSRLVGRRLGQDSGYNGEIVFFSPSGPRPFVARCLAESTPEVPATCLRDVSLGGRLSLLYRFNPTLLGDWKALDAGLTGLASGFLVSP